MRMNKFILSTICILLVSVLATGLAIQAVVAPRTGKTISVGVLPVPSVLGQTAEELLFYPWSMYDAQSLSVISDFYAKYEPENPGILMDLASADGWLDLLGAFQIFGVSYEQETMLNRLSWNMNEDGVISSKSNSIHIFLKDFPVQDWDESIVADFAYSQLPPQSVSYLIRPAQTVESSPEQQEEALAKVKSDLRDFLLYTDPLGNDLNMLVTDLFKYYEKCESAILSSLTTSLNEWKELLDSTLHERVEALDEYPPIEDILADVETFSPCNIQIVSTPQQIVILFQRDNGAVLGIYYDIYLKRYSGFGINA